MTIWGTFQNLCLQRPSAFNFLKKQKLLVLLLKKWLYGVQFRIYTWPMLPRPGGRSPIVIATFFFFLIFFDFFLVFFEYEEWILFCRQCGCVSFAHMHARAHPYPHPHPHTQKYTHTSTHTHTYTHTNTHVNLLVFEDILKSQCPSIFIYKVTICWLCRHPRPLQLPI